MNTETQNNTLQPNYDLLWYRIKRVLGRGAFGITYLAHDVNLDRLVAIKEYMPGYLSTRLSNLSVQPLTADLQEDFKFGLSRFISEGRTLTRFEHPNLVRVYNAFEANNTAYMVMNYEVGESLQEIIKRNKALQESEIIKIIMPLMEGLQKIHAQGFIHRDIKPGNIFIRKSDGSPVLLDFGSARQARQGTTQVLTSMVSPGYAPIEQYASNSDKQGPWTDIYGLAATIYKIITGTAPLNAVDRGEAIMHDGKDNYIPLTQQIQGRYTQTFLAAIDHALVFRATDRPQSIAEWKLEFLVPEDYITVEAKTASAGNSDIIRIDDITTENRYAVEEKTEKITGEPAARTDNTSQSPQKNNSAIAARFALTGNRRFIIPAGLGVIVIIAAAGIVLQMQGPESSVETFTVTPEIPTDVTTDTVTSSSATAVTQEQGHEREQTPLSTDQSVDENPEIQKLLAQAEQSLKELRLTTPAGNNAYEQYQQVLAQDSDNQLALDGIHAISDKYIALAHSALKNNNTERARLYTRKAQEIWPQSEKIQPANDALQAKLNEMADRDEATAAEEKAAVVEPAENPEAAVAEKGSEEEGFASGVKKWFKDQAEKNKDAHKQESTGDQFIDSIGGGK
jgi:Serine/threonine protein kinase